ncbi:MAG: hypothetical protein ACLQIB_40060 [Isosphaeraceae bacterium]
MSAFDHEKRHAYGLASAPSHDTAAATTLAAITPTILVHLRKPIRVCDLVWRNSMAGADSLAPADRAKPER